jgi:hypothetical protein
MSGLITTDHIDFRRGAAPTNPAASVDRVYWKNDGYPYTRDSAGVERAFMLTTVPEANKALIDNTAEAWAVIQGTDRYMVFKTTDGAEEVIVGADPSTVTTAKLTMRAGLGGWSATSTGGMTLDSAAALEINSSAGPINIGNDAVNQPMSYGTLGTRTLTYGSVNATHVYVGASYSYAIKDNVATPYTIQEGANKYYEIITTNASEEVKYGNATTNPKHTFLGTGLMALGGALTVTGLITANGGYTQTAGGFTYNVVGSVYAVTALTASFAVADNTAGAWQVKEAGNIYIDVNTTNGAEIITLGVGKVAVLKDLDVDGSIITKMGVTAGLGVKVGGTLYVNDDVSALVQNTSAETAFNKASGVLPSNTFLPGRRLRVRAGGTVVDTNAGGQPLSIRLQLFLNAATPVTLVTLALTVADGDNWVLDYDGHVLSVSVDTTRVFRQLWKTGAGQGSLNLTAKQDASPNVNTTQTAVVRVTAQWTNQHVDNKVQMDFLEVELG